MLGRFVDDKVSYELPNGRVLEVEIVKVELPDNQ